MRCLFLFLGKVSRGAWPLLASSSPTFRRPAKSSNCIGRLHLSGSVSALAGHMHVLLEILFSNLMEDAVRFPIRMVAAVLLMVPACSRNESRNVQAASEERTDQTNTPEQKMTERNDYVEAIDNRLAGFEPELDRFDMQANDMTRATKANFMSAIECLRAQRKSVASKLDDLKKADIESWTTLRGEVDSGLAKLATSFTRVRNMMYEKMPDRLAAP